MAENKQVEFWRGDFGNAYIGRNTGEEPDAGSRDILWKRVLSSLDEYPSSILEVGANIGLNLGSLSQHTDATLYALEPNAKARQSLEQEKFLSKDRILDGTADAIPLADSSVDMAFTCGVLIHVDPDLLLASCKEIDRVAARYIACAEYFSVEPEEISYRGHSGLLFKRDFGAFWMDNFPGLHLVDYGFMWKRATGLDNLTWWLFEKR